MENKKESIWVRLKRVIRRVTVPSFRGDGGAHSDKAIDIVTKPQTDSSFVIKDTAVVARPRN